MFISLIIFFCFATFAFADMLEQEKYNESIKELFNAKTIKCYWSKGVGVDYLNGKSNITEVQFNASTVFDLIDLKNSKARFIGTTGAGDVGVITTTYSITFVDVETLPIGDKITFITVYPDNVEENKFLCVQSLHSVLLQTPAPQQYYGKAEILE